MDPTLTIVFGVIGAIGAIFGVPPAVVTVLKYRQEQLDRKSLGMQQNPNVMLIQSSPVLLPAPDSSLPMSGPVVLLDENVDITAIYGREGEIDVLRQQILERNCRLIGISGMTEIGKTTLVSALLKQIRPNFDMCIGLSLQNAPKIEDTLLYLLNALQRTHNISLSSTVSQSISSLIGILQRRRCLLILDDAEAILKDGRIGQYRDGYEGYEELISKIGSILHKSCLILIGQELPEKLGQIGDFHSLPLRGLDLEAGWMLLASTGCYVAPEADPDKEIIVNHYAGNPGMLKIASALIREVWDGNVSRFVNNHLNQGMSDDEAIQELLKLHFNRLRSSERDVMYWLSIERESITLEALQENVFSPRDRGSMPSAIKDLLGRSLIEHRTSSSPPTFNLPKVVMNYTIQHFIEQICKEFSEERLFLLKTHSLLKAQAKDYIREAQLHFILQPILNKLLETFGNPQRLENYLKQTLFHLQSEPGASSRTNYLAGNVLNLLIQLQPERRDLSNQDFSNLVIRQALLRNVTLHNVNFSNSDLAQSVFSEAFEWILSVAFSLDGKLIATSESNGNIRLWRVLSSGKPVIFEKKHKNQVWSIAFSPDGKLVASGGEDRTTRLWDVNTGQHLKTFSHTDIVKSVAFHPQSNVLATGGNDQIVRLWSTDSEECFMSLQTGALVNSVAFSPDGKTLAIGLQDGTVSLWHIAKDECIRSLSSHTDVVYSVSFSPNGTKLASGSGDGRIFIWNVETGECIQTSNGYNTRIRSIVFSPDGEKLAFGGDDRVIRLWSIHTGQTQTMQGDGHTSRVRSVAFSPDGQTIVSGSDDCFIKIWETNDTRCCKTLAGGSTNRFWSIALDYEGKLLASGSEDGIVRLWNIHDPKNVQVMRELQGHNTSVWSVAFSPNAKMLASSDENGDVRLWDIRTGTTRTLKQHTSRVRSVTFNNSGYILASAGADKTICLWDVDSGDLQRRLVGHADRVLSVAFSPKVVGVLVSGGQDKKLIVWNVITEEHKILTGHGAQVHSVAFSPDGSLLASGSYDRTIKIWDTNTWECLHTLPEQDNQILSVGFSPDGRILASCGHDRDIKIWDVNQRNFLKSPQDKHNRAVESVIFAPNGRILISASQDGTIRLWDITTDEQFEPVRIKRLYEGMNITGVRGLTEAQKTDLKALGAIEIG